MPRRRNLSMVEPPAGHWGAVLRERRLQIDISQITLAERASEYLDAPIQQGMVSRYERGEVQRTEPSIAAALEKALEMEPDTLMNLMGYGRGGRRLAAQTPPPGSLIIGPDPNDPLYQTVVILKDWSDEDIARLQRMVELESRARQEQPPAREDLSDSDAGAESA